MIVIVIVIDETMAVRIEKTCTSTSSLKRTLYHLDDNILAMKYGGRKCYDLVLLFHQHLASLQSLKGRRIPGFLQFNGS